jgi:cell wall-associated NlpC family hydrolase
VPYYRIEYLRVPYRRRYGRPRAGSGAQGALVAVVAGAALALAAGHVVHATAHHPHAGHVGEPRAVRVAIGYAEQQLGKPYQWGGIGPYSFDCSGLVMEAELAAGISIPRTSQAQWAQLPHVTRPRPGDLVFFPGSDGTWAAPGHVALVISRTKMIQAYATGTPIEVSPLNGNGAGGIVGFARP